MKILNGAEIAGYMKANQAHMVWGLRARKIYPKLVIIRDNDDPVIAKYVSLKQKYGEDIGVEVEDWLREDVDRAIVEANNDKGVHGIIVQLPLKDMSKVDEIVAKIAPEKDVDGLGSNTHAANEAKNEYSSHDITRSANEEISSGISSEPTPLFLGHKAHDIVFESATATAINWLLAGYDVKMDGAKIALVGRGRLVGAPLERMWKNSGYDVTVFRSHSDLSGLRNYQIIVSATGVPHLIKSEMVAPGATVVDAGTASEGGVLVGDIDRSVRARQDLSAITPKIGGVGPLTVTTLFEHVIMAAKNA